MALDDNLRLLAQAIGVDIKALRSWINGNAADLSGLTTTAKGNLVAAINELAARSTGGATINDAATNTTQVWSSSKVASSISTAVSNLVNGAPTALDTLKELADALAADDSDIAALVAALDKRVAVNAAQSFTTAEQTQGRANIGAASAADVGPTGTNYVTLYNTAKA